MNGKILHIAVCDKFIPPFIEFVKNNLNFDEHEFLISSGMAKEDIVVSKNIILGGKNKSERIRHRLLTILKMHHARKIILHGLFDIRLVKILFFMPWLLRKCYWVMWGGDLYIYQTSKHGKRWFSDEFFRRAVIKRIGNLVTYVEGDVALAREWYGARGKYCECIMYPSNVYVERDISEVDDGVLNIQVGNSADPSNNHIDALRKLLPYKDENIRIYLPLSYGDKEYALDVIERGRTWFGDKFVPITEFLPFESYLKFLSRIDIAIFNHKRQQAMGNTIMLLGLGKKVFLRSDVTQWELFESLGISVGDVDNLSVEQICRSDMEKNKKAIKGFFSNEMLIRGLNSIFRG